MEIVNLLLNRQQIEIICCLCFKHDENTMHIFHDLFIQDENRIIITTVFKMLKFIIPSQDIFLNQACNDCTQLIIRMYLTLRRHAQKVKLFRNIINNLEENVEKQTLLSQKESCKIHINTKKNKTEERKKLPRKKNNEMSNNLVSCQKCGMEFTSKEVLQEHKKISHYNSNSAIVCDVCGKVFKTPNSLKSHFNCHNEKHCPYCSKNLKSHSHFKLHIKNHLKKTRRIRKIKYRCNDCDYMCIDKNSLEAHMNRKHLNKRPHVCTLCFKGYFKKKTLTEHMKTHKVTRNLTCEVCGENFLYKKSLINHLRLHSGEKPYECEVCQAKFVTNGRRWEHMKRKHMEKTELCSICNKKYSMKNELKRHMEKVHGANS